MSTVLTRTMTTISLISVLMSAVHAAAAVQHAPLPTDTVLREDSPLQLPEVTVRSKHHRILHMLAYVREYSTLTTYTDTVFLFREKSVDYMLPTDSKTRFRGWKAPRTLSSRSYYRFTDTNGLDSVSDRCNNHFSWADWVSLVIPEELPANLHAIENGTDTVYGRYSPTEIWEKRGGRLTLDVDVMADTTSRKWVPNLSAFFRKNIDFERFRLHFNYNGVIEDSVSPVDLTDYCFDIASNGRGRGMFMFNRVDEPFYVTTHAEVYIVDKEFITVKEAKKREHGMSAAMEAGLFEPYQAPPLPSDVRMLVDRVNSVDHDGVRLALEPDLHLMGRGVVKLNFGQKVLQRVKGMFGLDKVNAERKWKRGWRKFTREQTSRNRLPSEAAQ